MPSPGSHENLRPLRPIAPRTAASPAVPPPPTSDDGKIKRASTACTECQKRRTKCTGGNPCSECSLHGRECIFNESGDRRRKLSAKRVASELEWYIQFVDQLLKTIREGNQTTVDLVVDSIRSGTSVEDLKTLLNNYLPQSRGGLQMGPAPEPSDTPPMHSDASSRNQEDHS